MADAVVGAAEVGEVIAVRVEDEQAVVGAHESGHPGIVPLEIEFHVVALDRDELRQRDLPGARAEVVEAAGRSVRRAPGRA